VTIARVLVANRGEIAVRIIRACQSLGLETVLAASEADRDSLPARMADRTVCIGPAAASSSYLDPKIIVTAARGTGADAVHPGYGFLAESPVLADLCAAHGLTFVGPRAEQIRRMGNKLEARELARRCGLPILSGSTKVGSAEEAMQVADRIGLPLMMKAASGGGGRGMKIVTERSDIKPRFVSAAAEARASFGDDTLYFERYIPNARHIEVQVLGDRFGNLIHLGERDCSLQRRHQKIVEEAPAPEISEMLREEIRQAAVRLAGELGYESAGTVEFILDQDAGRFYFLEMNTRIQVEHPVTEAITEFDIVREQFRIAAGEPLKSSQADVVFHGHAIECRITAEDPGEGFRPNGGRITEWRPPEDPHIRLDTHCYAGYAVPIFYDSLLAKLIVHGTDRHDAIRRMNKALAQFQIAGVATIVPFLRRVMSHGDFVEGRVNTRLLEMLMRELSTVMPATA
jgi:acetyl-CoA carboxylase biotin carboxylase subunit